MAGTKNKKLKAWVITVDMGYGHQRASYPLRHLAYGGIINANTYKGIPQADRKIWENQRKFYEAVSRFKRVPIIGEIVFEIMDQFQKIPKFYPKRDLSKPSWQIAAAAKMIKSKNWGAHLIKKISAKPEYPLITPFFIPAMMAEIHGFTGEIYLIICDADISRAWAPLRPSSSKVNYFVPNQRVAERLREYGVNKNRIILTGFPLPEENIGGASYKILRHDFKQRLVNLDPHGSYSKSYQDTLLKALKIRNLPKKSNHPLTLTFAVGGAGAQRELGGELVKYLAKDVLARRLNINLIAGVHKDVELYFKKAVQGAGLARLLNKSVNILFVSSKQEYMKTFNHLLRTTDILWTKPSELSFYTALGLPIIIAPPIGSQEDFNKQWLVYLGGGIAQENPKYSSQWLFDWIQSGRLAEAAAQGFLEAPKNGLANIIRYLKTGCVECANGGPDI